MLRRHGTAKGWTRHTGTLVQVIAPSTFTYTPDLWLTNTSGAFHHTTTVVIT